MRCKNCDYRLWNLTARTCPECGRPFKPSEFEFVLNSVRFCCPHCDQPYYGTGPNGHLVPSEFDCTSCRRHVHMDEMVLFPTDAVSEEQTEVDYNPWLERKRRGVFRCWFKMIGRAMVGPGRLMRATPEASSIADAWWFAFLMIFVSFCMGLGLLFVLPMLGGGWFGAVWALLLPIGALGLLALWGVTTQGMLALLAPNRGGLGRTFQALCYSGGTCIIAAVPCLCQLTAPVVCIWWTVSAILMVKDGHQVSGGRAAAAVLLGGGALAAVGVYTATTRFTTAMATMQQGAGPQNVIQAVNMYAITNAGNGPDHVIELIVDGSLVSDDFIAPDTMTLQTDVPVGKVTLEDFDVLLASDQAIAAAALVNRLPANTTAYRFGDMVLTYRGIDLNKADPNLWIVIESPDPDVNMTAGPTTLGAGLICVGLASGVTSFFAAQTMAAELAAQNALRSKYNLPPLPDPSTVTHAQPATAATATGPGQP
jgi:hypothetical protein